MNRWKRAWWRLRRLKRLVSIALPVGVIVMVIFLIGRAVVHEEWKSTMPKMPRSMAEIRGLVDNLYRYRETFVPSFVPQSGWDDELCAATVSGAVNFLLGEARLKTDVPAWQFRVANRNHIREIYNREDDFAIQDGRVVEVRERNFWLSRHLKTVGHGAALTADRLYVLGYHYQRTRSDPWITEAREDNREAGLNSHLMLILGRYDGSWWGYHLFHDPEHPDDNPFRIDNIGSCDEERGWCMPNHFDAVYIWEILESEMPEKFSGSRLLMVQNSPPYRQVVSGLGWAPIGEHIVDTLLVLFFGSGDNFPRVVDAGVTVVDLADPSVTPKWHGQVLGLYLGEPIRVSDSVSFRGTFGLEFECVEYVNRLYARQLGHRNMTKSGNADTYFYAAAGKRLIAYPNGSPEPPRAGDIMVFDPPGLTDDNPGHVGIVYEVREHEVCMVGQNIMPWRQCVPLDRRDNGWYIGPITPTLECVGWSRRKGG